MERAARGCIRYQGYLDQTPFPEIFGRLVMARETGILVITRGEISRSISFVGGDPVFATSNLQEDTIGSVLASTGKVSRDRVDQARAHAGEGGAEALLRELGIEGEENRRTLLLEQLGQIIRSSFEWRSGEFDFLALEPAAGYRANFPRPAPALLVEGVRRSFSKAEILRRLKGDGGVPHYPVPPPPSALRLGLTDEEAVLLAAIDGKKAVGQLLAEAARPEEAARLLYALVCLGSVRMRILL